MNILDPIDMYRLSKTMHSLAGLFKSLLDTQCYRYSAIVDNSSRGLECVYARGTHRIFLSEKEWFKIGKILDQCIEDMSALRKQVLAVEQQAASTDLAEAFNAVSVLS